MWLLDDDFLTADINVEFKGALLARDNVAILLCYSHSDQKQVYGFELWTLETKLNLFSQL